MHFDAITTFHGTLSLMCGSRKYPYPSHEWSLEILRGWWISKAKIFKRKYEAKLEFPGGWGGVQSEKPSMGKVWIFSGTTQYKDNTTKKFVSN